MFKAYICQALNYPHVKRELKGPLVKAFIRLSKALGLYPESLVLKGVEMVGNHAVAQGNFGDVWKGLTEGQEVAIKVLRKYVRSDVQKLLKVWSICLFALGVFLNITPCRTFHAKLRYGNCFHTQMCCRFTVYIIGTTPIPGLLCVALDGKWEHQTLP